MFPAPNRNAWAMPSGFGCSTYSIRIPSRVPVAEIIAQHRQILRRRDIENPQAAEHQRREG